MTLTLLLDLDDTLLANDFDTFLPAYLKLLGKHMISYIAPDQLIQKLMVATQVMQLNNSAVLSLERSFDQAFYPAIGYTKADLRETLEKFYDEIFPTLSVMTGQRPEAAELVKYAQEQGYQLVVATNPLFPYRAMVHRLRWAGLDPDRVPFTLITAYERFHFAKPNPAYFAEILAHLGWPDQPAVMVGNSLEDDLRPANALGMPVYWVTDQNQTFPAGFHPLSVVGTLEGVPGWLEQINHSKPSLDFSTPTALLAVLKSTPAVLDSLVRELSRDQLHVRLAPGEWSLTEIFSHLRDVDQEVNLARFKKVIQGTNPFLPGINTDTWAKERDYQSQDGIAAASEFIETRTRLVTMLEALEVQDWEKPARHAIFGPTNLTELIGFVATHDRTHIQQSLATARGFGL